MNRQQQISYGMETNSGYQQGGVAFGTGYFDVKQAPFEFDSCLKPVKGNDVLTMLADTMQYNHSQDSTENQVTKVPRVSIKGSGNVLMLQEDKYCVSDNVDLHNKRKKTDCQSTKSSSPPLPRKKPFKPTDKSLYRPQKTNISQLEESLQKWNELPAYRSETNKAFTFDEQFTEEDIRWISTGELDGNEKVQEVTFNGMRLVTKICYFQEENKVSSNEILIPLQYKEHKNIVKIVGVFMHSSYVCIVMKYAGLSLVKLLQECPSFRKYCNEHMEDLYRDLCRLVYFLDFHGISHNDIKPDNICASQEGSVFTLMLIDFDAAYTKQDDPSIQPRYTPEYIPPCTVKALLQAMEDEIVPGCNSQPGPQFGRSFFTDKVDFWAISMTVCYLMCRGHHPYFATSAVDLTLRAGIKDHNIRRDYFNQIVENINDQWMDHKLLPKLHDSYGDSDFFNCLHANLILDRDKWSNQKTLVFINRERKHFNETLNLNDTSTASTDEIQSLRRSFVKIHQSESRRQFTAQNMGKRAPNSGQTQGEKPYGQQFYPSIAERKIPPQAFTMTNLSWLQASPLVPRQNSQAILMPQQGFLSQAVPATHGQSKFCLVSQVMPVSFKPTEQVGPKQEENYVSTNITQRTRSGYILQANENATYSVRRRAHPVPELHLSEVVFHKEAVPSAQIIPMKGSMFERQSSAQGVPIQNQNYFAIIRQKTRPGNGLSVNGNSLCKGPRMTQQSLPEAHNNEGMLYNYFGLSAQGQTSTAQVAPMTESMSELQTSVQVLHGHKQGGLAATGQNNSQISVLRMKEPAMTTGSAIDRQAGPSPQWSNVFS